MMTNTEAPMSFLKQVFGGAWITQGLGVAAELGIADRLSGGPQTAEYLARQAGADAEALRRVLRALASTGVFSEDAQGRFGLTPVSELLRSAIPGSQRAFATMMGAELHDAWGGLLHSVRTGEAGFDARFGMPFFQYMTDHPERHRIYDAAMTAIHGRETAPMLEAIDFAPFRTVVDVGGGNGSLLAAVLRRHPASRGILLDLPPVAERAAAELSGAGLSGRFEIACGDFFSSVPPGGDAYILRHIVHDWEDREAIAILRNCREAMGPEGRVLVVESVIPEGSDPCFGKWLDLMMLIVGGRERTAQEFRRLFASAGLSLKRIVPTAAEVSVLEATRAA